MWQFVEGSHGTTPELIARLDKRIGRLPLHTIECSQIRMELLQLAIDSVVAQLAIEAADRAERWD